MARPVLLIHSSGLSSRQWRRAAQMFGGVCVAPDLVGYGERPRWLEPGPFDWRWDLDVVREALLGLAEPADLVAHSYGGFLALRLAREHPDRVSRMVLHEPIAWGSLRSCGDPHMQRRFDKVLASIFGVEHELGDARWMQVFVDFWNGAGSWDALGQQRREALLRVGHKVGHEVYAICHDVTPHATWRAVRTPTLITVGGDSPIEEQFVCSVLRDTLVDATLERTSGGHMAPLTHADDVLPRWSRFLGRSE